MRILALLPNVCVLSRVPCDKMVKKLIWNEISSDNALNTRALLVSERTQSILLAALEYVQKEYVWVGDYDEIDAAIGEAVKEVLVIEDTGMVDCGDVADCVESELITNEILQESIYNYVNNSGFGNNTHINTALTTIYDKITEPELSEPIAVLEDCDLSVLWGAIRGGIVPRINDNAIDMLQDLEPIADVGERLQVFIDIVPVIGDLVEALAEQITEVIPDLLALYESAESEALLDEIACDLFGLVCADCRYPTFKEVIEYYQSRAIGGLGALETVTMEQVAELLLEVVFEPAEIAYFTINFWQLLVLNFQSVFNGEYKSSAITKFAALGADNPDDDYLDLCDDCVEDYAIVTWDFKSQQYNSYKTSGYSNSGGTYVVGKGWRVDKITSTDGRLTVALPLDASWKIRSLSYRTSVPKTDYTNYAVDLRTIAGSNTSSTGLNMTIDSSSDANVRCRSGLAELTNFMEVAISIIRAPQAETYLERITIVFSRAFSPLSARSTTNNSACDAV